MNMFPYIFLFLSPVASCLAQGYINTVRSQILPILPVYKALEPCNPAGARERALGSAYSAELWFATGINRPEATLLRIESLPTVTLDANGRFGFPSSGLSRIDEAKPGDRITLQLRVWENRGGTVASWSDASRSADLAFGKSIIIGDYLVSGKTSDGAMHLGGSIFDYVTSRDPITISAVCPEPSSYLLLALGAGCGLIMRRRSAGGTKRARAQY